jgi:hypothetical protein
MVVEKVKGMGAGVRALWSFLTSAPSLQFSYNPAAITMSSSPLASSTRNSAPVTNDDFAKLAL